MSGVDSAPANLTLDDPDWRIDKTCSGDLVGNDEGIVILRNEKIKFTDIN